MCKTVKATLGTIVSKDILTKSFNIFTLTKQTYCKKLITCQICLLRYGLALIQGHKKQKSRIAARLDRMMTNCQHQQIDRPRHCFAAAWLEVEKIDASCICTFNLKQDNEKAALWI